jgi:hypothetical protein
LDGRKEVGAKRKKLCLAGRVFSEELSYLFYWRLFETGTLKVKIVIVC